MAATASRRSWSQVMTSTLSSEEPSSAGIADSGQLAQLNASRGGSNQPRNPSSRTAGNCRRILPGGIVKCIVRLCSPI